MATEVERLRVAAEAARSARESLPHGRVRLTPAMHQELAYDVCGGFLNPDAVVVQSVGGMRVEIDADVPDPGWILETWR